MKNVIIRISRNIIFLILLVAIIDILFGVIFNFIMYNSPDGRYFKSIHTLETSTADILIMGSSKAETNFNPHVFEKTLGLSVWNSGRGGQSIPFFRCVQEATLKRYIPKIVILNLGAYRLENELDKNRYMFLKPFYWSHPEIRPILERKSNNEKYLMFSSLYRYNSVFYYLFRSFVIHGIDGDVKMKGMKPRIGSIKLDTSLNYKHKIERDEKTLKEETILELEILLKKFNEAGVQLYVVISPDFQPGDKTPSIDVYNKLSEKYNFKIINLMNDNDFIYKPELFKDAAHLNLEGANILSNKVAKKIKSMLHN
ncbi:hypothetical protein EGM88_12390 [Aureibaculum marinum]|uniref:SGNH/GDSL hydrolase family protein n=1 Tax=Aureibaculum marinum TaxID=2487930 RepID=A0A3N4NDV7_9FLAO|nr:hypothetical protein [Aureibaculum marinum]RPD94371.1 hypothetical protein EGM88_12390 [Aureibaculum marinum]